MRLILCLVLIICTNVARAQLAELQPMFVLKTPAAIAHFHGPPRAGSPEDREDMMIVHEYQIERTKAECAAAAAQRSLSLQSIFGRDLSENELSQLDELFAHVFIDTDHFVNLVKSRYQRPRPFVRDRAIKTCVDRLKSTSYPSGHAAISRSMARTLGLIFPARAKAFLDDADIAGRNRILGGVHHPSDVRAGQELGELVFKEMQKSVNFRENVRALKNSLTK